MNYILTRRNYEANDGARAHRSRRAPMWNEVKLSLKERATRLRPDEKIDPETGKPWPVKDPLTGEPLPYTGWLVRGIHLHGFHGDAQLSFNSKTKKLEAVVLGLDPPDGLTKQLAATMVEADLSAKYGKPVSSHCDHSTCQSTSQTSPTAIVEMTIIGSEEPLLIVPYGRIQRTFGRAIVGSF